MAKCEPSGDGMVRKRSTDGRWEGRIVVGHRADLSVAGMLRLASAVRISGGSKQFPCARLLRLRILREMRTRCGSPLCSYVPSNIWKRPSAAECVSPCSRDCGMIKRRRNVRYPHVMRRYKNVPTLFLYERRWLLQSVQQ